MLDVKKQVVTALNTISGIDVQYELFYNSTTVPCITYIEYKNADDLTGDTFGYSNIGFTITVWTNTVDDSVNYSKLVDSKMRQLGFRRRNSNEMIQGSLIRRVSDYECLGIENY